jgi:hypothetical protein
MIFQDDRETAKVEKLSRKKNLISDKHAILFVARFVRKQVKTLRASGFPNAVFAIVVVGFS